MTLDPALGSVLELLATSGAPPMSQGTPGQAREAFRFLTVGMRDPAVLAQVDSTEDGTLPGASAAMACRTYRPGTPGPHPTVLFLHGGGFVIGDLDTHDDHARLLCRDVDAVVVSVDYRLAPEHPFPAGHEDCVAAHRWVVDNVAELGGDPARIGVAGDSAGGNLSAGVALAARDAGLPLAAQLLLYPAVDFSDDPEAHPSRQANAEGFFLTAEDMRWFRDHYLPDPAMAGDPRASVLHTPLAGVAPAVVATAGYDPLRDEGEAYAKALAGAGVEVVSRSYDALIHGFFGLGHVSAACAAADTELCADFKALLAR